MDQEMEERFRVDRMAIDFATALSRIRLLRECLGRYLEANKLAKELTFLPFYAEGCEEALEDFLAKMDPSIRQKIISFENDLKLRKTDLPKPPADNSQV